MITPEHYAILCDVVERAWQNWPVDPDELVKDESGAVAEWQPLPAMHTSDYARAAANRIIEELGLEEEDTPRSLDEIVAAETELFDRLWYGRKPSDDNVPPDWQPDIVEGMLKAKREVEAKYGLESLAKDVETDWAWGYLSGRISAIRWILGSDWGMLDS